MRRLTEPQAKFLANLVAKAKEQLGYSNKEIAKRAGFKSDKVARDVLNARCLVAKTVEAICRAVDVNCWEELKKAGLEEEIAVAGTSPSKAGTRRTSMATCWGPM
jgi:hypothetical protein